MFSIDGPRFTVRIELHGVQHDGHLSGGHRSNEYAILHEEMRRRGFAREVEDHRGRMVRLPPAEYDFKGNVTVAYVLARAKEATEAAISKIEASPQLTFSVLITRTETQRLWDNLPEIEP